MSELINDIPSFLDGHHAFSAINFISSLTLNGVPLMKAFNFLEHCYESGIIRNLSEEELKFLGSMTSHP